MKDKFKNKVVVVTGAGNGIGKAIAKSFAHEGASVVVNDIEGKSVKKVVAEINNNGGKSVGAIADVSKGKQVDYIFKVAIKEYNSVNILINNAGRISPMLHFFEATEKWWRQIIDINLTGHFLCAQRAAKIMAKQGKGVIINMSSGGATRAHRAFCAYDASKGGIEALTRAMALDLGPYGIRVCALMPGSIDTEGMDEQARLLRGENIPLGRPGEPHDLSGPAMFLASEDACYITGDVIKVDGGMLSQQRSATVDIVHPNSFPKISEIPEEN